MLKYSKEDIDVFYSLAEQKINKLGIELKHQIKYDVVDSCLVDKINLLSYIVDSCLETEVQAELDILVYFALDYYNLYDEAYSPFLVLPYISVNSTGGSTISISDVIGLQDIIDNLNPVFENDITVSLSDGKTMGKYLNGETIPSSGKTAEQVFRLCAIEDIPPVYTQPSFLFTLSSSGKFERGTTFNTTLNFGFTQNDAGDLNKIEVYRNGSILRSDSVLPIDLSSMADSVVLPEGIYNYQSMYYYNEGIIKNSLPSDTPYPDTHILANEYQSPVISAIGVQPWFYGSSSIDSVPNIYSGTKVINFFQTSMGFSSISVPSFGSGTKWLWFAVPRSSTDNSQRTFINWYRTALDNGSIGGTTNLFRSPVTVSVSSTGLTTDWTRNYDLYFSNYATDASVATTLS